MPLKDLSGKTLGFGVTGGIGAYKALEVISRLRKRGAEVVPIMTEAATEFVAPLSFQTISGNPVYHEMFAEPKQWHVEHIALAERMDGLVVVPATANLLAKAAAGIADDYLTTVLLAYPGPVLMAPAMNTNMWHHPVTQRNVATLRELGYAIVTPDRGRLASGAEGMGRLPDPEVIAEEIVSYLHADQALSGKTVLVTAGPTREYFDPVRFLSNPSSGKMGYALAQAARERGAFVHLVSGPTSLRPPRGVDFHSVVTAEEMHQMCLKLWKQVDILLMAAAVMDARPKVVHAQKMKKACDPLLGDVVLTPDILADLADQKGSRHIVGFAAETDEQCALAHAHAKRREKGLDMVVLNRVDRDRVGFSADASTVHLLTSDESIELPPAHKRVLARKILSKVVDSLHGGSP